MSLTVSYTAMKVYVKGMIVIVLRIIITTVKPEGSSPVRMGIKRITVREQGGLPDREAMRVKGLRLGKVIFKGSLRKHLSYLEC